MVGARPVTKQVPQEHAQAKEQARAQKQQQTQKQKQRQEQKPQPQPQIREEIGVSVLVQGQAPTLRVVRSTVEVLQTQFADRVVDIPGEQRRDVSSAQQVQVLNKVVDTPVAVKRQGSVDSEDTENRSGPTGPVH